MTPEGIQQLPRLLRDSARTFPEAHARELMLEAADEIVRLRALVKELEPHAILTALRAGNFVHYDLDGNQLGK